MATKAVDATQLDGDLTSVANAIRQKGGTSAALSFPAGFVSAVQAIPTPKQEQTKTVNISQNGTTTIFPDTGKVLSGATVNVNVQGGGGKNKQYSNGCGAAKTGNTYQAVDGNPITIQVTKTGTYTAKWHGFRAASYDSGGTQLFINGSSYGSAQTSFNSPDKWTQSPSVNGISLTAGSTIAVYARASSSSDIYVFGLYIEEE